MSIILKNAMIMTMNENREIKEKTSLVIENKKIVAIGNYVEIQQQFSNAEVVDCQNKLIMPGLIDVHAHGGISLFKSVVKDTNQWMSSLTHTVKNYLDDEFWRIESSLSALNRLRYGVTTGVSLLGTQPRCDSFRFAKNQTDGYAEIGVRNFLAVGPNAGPWPHRLSIYEKGERIRKEVTYEDAITSLDTIVAKLHHANDDKTQILVAPYQIVTSIMEGTEGDMLEKLTEEDLRNSRELRRIAKKHKARIHTDAFRGMVKLAYDDPNAFLGPDVYIQHNFGISLDEVNILAETKTNASFTPTFAQFRLNTPVMEMMERGINVAITSDGESYHSNFNMFEKMLVTQQMVRSIYKDRNYLPNEKIIEMMTIDAAKCIGMEKEIGSIEIGKKADILVIDLNKPHLTPFFDLPHLVVREVRPSDITQVYIDGVLLLNNGKTIHLDEQLIMSNATKKAKEVIKNAHLEKFAYPEKHFWKENKAYYEEQRYDIKWQREDGGYY